MPSFLLDLPSLGAVSHGSSFALPRGVVGVGEGAFSLRGGPKGRVLGGRRRLPLQSL